MTFLRDLNLLANIARSAPRLLKSHNHLLIAPILQAQRLSDSCFCWVDNMSDLFESKSFVADGTFWERVRHVAMNIEQEVEKTTTHEIGFDDLLTEASMAEVQALRSPPLSPISPPLSPVAPVYSPVTPPKSTFPAHPQTMICSPDVSPITPPERTPLHLETKSISAPIAPTSRESKTTYVAHARLSTGPTQPRRGLPKSSHKAFNIHEDITVNVDPSSSSTSATGRATRPRKHLPPVSTTPASFITKAAKQPVFGAVTGDLIDPITSRPYIPSEIIPPSVQDSGKHANHGSQTRAYINTKVTPTLLEGLKIVAEVEPEKPLWWLGDFLMRKSAELETDED